MHVAPISKVLLLAQDSSLREFVRDALADQYEVTVAVDCLEAADLLREQTYSLLIVDPVLPVMDGGEFLHILRSLAEFSPLPVVALIDSVKPDPQFQALDIQRFLAKPFPVEQLRICVAEVSRFSRPVTSPPLTGRKQTRRPRSPRAGE